MIKVRQELDSLHIRLPRRQRASSSARRKTLYTIAGVMVVGSVLGASINIGLTSLNEAGLLCPAGLATLIPYLGIFFVIRRVSAPGEVVLSQRMLRMEGRKALEVPLEEVQRIEMITQGDRGRLRFHTTHGELDLFDGLFLHELEWLHHTVSEHTERLRLQMQQDGYDTDVVARPPKALTELVP